METATPSSSPSIGRQADRLPPPSRAVRAGGLTLVLGALAFVAVFAALASRMGYPDVLDRPASEVLPLLAAGGAPLRAIWFLYALLPLSFIPGALAADGALGHRLGQARGLGVPLASLAALCMSLGLARWPTIHWSLAALPDGDPERVATVAALFDGLNLYLGRFVGELLGELFANAWFLLCGVALARGRGAERWVGWLGIATAVLGTVGSLRNATALVQPVADLNNALLPLWLVALGLVLSGVRGRGVARAALAAGLLLALVPAAKADEPNGPADGGHELAVNGFRSPSIGLEYRWRALSVHAGAYPTIVEPGARGVSGTTWFLRTGARLDVWRVPLTSAGPSALFVDASWVRGLGDGWKDGLMTEVGFRLRAWKGLEARLGVALLLSPDHRPRVNPTPGLSWVVPL